jgi:hypothetical protein
MHAHRVECHDIYKVAAPAPCVATNVVVCLVVIVVPIDVIARDLPRHSTVVVVRVLVNLVVARSSTSRARCADHWPPAV